MERLIVVDAANRNTSLYPSGNTYVVHLSSPIRNISRVDLVSAHLPNTIYNLDTPLSVMTVNTSSNIYLPPGFYNACSLATALTARGFFEAVYIPTEGKFIFSHCSQFTFVIHSPEFAKLVGFLPNVVYTSHLGNQDYDPCYSAFYIIRSIGIIDLSFNEIVHLDIDEFRTPNHVSTGAIINSSGTITGANAGRSFAPIIMDVNSASIKNFKESDYKISVFYPEPIGVLTRLTVRWYDKNGSLLNFRGLDTNSFVVRVHTIEHPRLPPPPPVEEVELKRYIEVVAPPAPPEKKRKIPWTLISILILIGTLFYFNVLRRTPSAPV